MKVMIAGGTGLIGSALVERLLPGGHEVWVLTRSPVSAGLPEKVHHVRWDARSPDGWGELLEEMDAVINLAGENLGAGRWTAERKIRILNSRILAGRAIVEAFRQAERKPEVLIQASAIGYYGEHTGNQVLSPDSPPGDDFLARVCLAWEDSTHAVEEMGVRRVITRSGLVMAKGEGWLDRLLLPYRLFVGGPLAGGHQWWSWIHIVDEVGAMQFLMENRQARGVFNLAAPNPVHMADFGRLLARMIRRPYWFPVPGFLLRLVLGEMSTLVLSSQRVLPTGLEELGYEFRFETLKPALEDVLR